MKIKVISQGETTFKADAEYEEPAIREAIEDGCNDVASTIIDHTDSERRDISHDEYAAVTEDDGTVLWSGWLDGRDEPAPGALPVAVESEIGGRIDQLLGWAKSGKRSFQSDDPSEGPVEFYLMDVENTDAMRNHILRIVRAEIAKANRPELLGQSS